MFPNLSSNSFSSIENASLLTTLCGILSPVLWRFLESDFDFRRLLRLLKFKIRMKLVFWYEHSTTVLCSFVPLWVKLLSSSADIHKMLLLIKKHQKNTTVCKCYAKVFESMSQTKERILRSDVYIESNLFSKERGAQLQNMQQNYEKK